MAVHAEEDDVVTYMTDKLKREGRAQGHNLHLVHNNLSEDLAFRHIIRLARLTEAAVYFVHTTAREGVAAVAEARAMGLPVYGEALHNYLHFTCDDYKKPGGTAIHTYPAIKFAEDRDALLAGLLDGRLATTATDEYTVHKAYKLSGDTIETVCGGHNGIETRRAGGLHEVRGRAPDAAHPLRGHHLGQRRPHPRPLSEEGRHPAGERRRPGPDRPGDPEDDLPRRPARRCRLQHLGGLRLPGLPGDDHPPRQGHRRGSGRLVGSSSDGQWVARRVAGDVLSRPAV